MHPLNQKQTKQGFTVVELLVVLFIMVLLVTIAVPSFRSWRERQDLTAAQRELVTYLQRARSNALTGRRINNNVAKYHIVKFDRSKADNFFIEGISYPASTGNDVIYSEGTGNELEEVQLPGQIAIKNMSYERPVGTNQADPSCVYLAFGLPYGNTYIDTEYADGIDDDGACDFYSKYQDSVWLKAWSNARLVITLAKPGSTLSKTISINGVTGQIQAD